MHPQFTASDIERFWAKVNKDGPIPAHRPELGPCWMWTASTTREGYGCFRMPEHLIGAHRVSWMIAYGEIQGNRSVLHHCDNPTCVRPDHLFKGTQTDNMRDCANKGRSGALVHPERLARGERNGAHTHPEKVPRGEMHYARLHPERMARGERHGSVTTPGIHRGERNGSAKLTDSEICAIRSAYAKGGVTQVALAKEYNVHQTLISLIVRNAIWAHLP